jgi:hypothetical protein
MLLVANSQPAEKFQVMSTVRCNRSIATAMLAAGLALLTATAMAQPALPAAGLEIIERAGHNPHDERTAEVMRAIRNFIPTGVGVQAAAPATTA